MHPLKIIIWSRYCLTICLYIHTYVKHVLCTQVRNTMDATRFYALKLTILLVFLILASGLKPTSKSSEFFVHHFLNFTLQTRLPLILHILHTKLTLCPIVLLVCM